MGKRPRLFSSLAPTIRFFSLFYIFSCATRIDEGKEELKEEITLLCSLHPIPVVAVVVVDGSTQFGDVEHHQQGRTYIHTHEEQNVLIFDAFREEGKLYTTEHQLRNRKRRRT